MKKRIHCPEKPKRLPGVPAPTPPPCYIVVDPATDLFKRGYELGLRVALAAVKDADRPDMLTGEESWGWGARGAVDEQAIESLLEEAEGDDNG